ncbi:MAG: methyltransferase domain-containing protein [Rhodospirillaceae bacterium]|nr:methyltransferase domain-containing protein [Rhodospirillaceae bacterium]
MTPATDRPLANWADLAAELARWRAERRQPTMWWRDDDAAANTPALGRLLALRSYYGPPLSLAVIPALADATLAEALGFADNTTVLQHGWSHRNFGPAGGTKIELGGARSLWEIAADLSRGHTRLVEMIEPVLLPVLVPPYNAIDPGIVGILGSIGFKGLSTWAARPTRHPYPGLAQANVHVDLIDWYRTRAFAGEDIVLGQAVAHLAARRRGQVDREEPTGINTHHLAMDEPGWAFLERFITETMEAGVDWLSAATVFGLPQTADCSSRMSRRVMRTGPACNICGGKLYGLGPFARKSYVGIDVNPRCIQCNSLERHRAIRRLYDRLPAAQLDWRNVLFFAPDPSLEPSWFSSFETSQYLGENHMDMQDIPREDGRYDLVAVVQTIEMIPDDRKAFAELARVCSDRSVIQIVFLTDLTAVESEHFATPQPPHGWHHLFNSDVFKRWGAGTRGFRVLKVYEPDPTTGYVQLVCFLFRQPDEFEAWKSCWAGQGLQVEEVPLEIPGEGAGSVIPAAG